jgi:predicted Fe-Mo cluster-binding NifX family protein
MKKKIAVPVDNNGMLDGHFGHCKFFSIFQTDEDSILTEERLIPPAHEPGVLPQWMADLGVTDVLAGGMGNRAIQLFNQNNVNVFVGAPQLNASDLVIGFLNQAIEFNANYCDH